MLFSRSCEYAIQAILYLAHHYDTPYVSIKEISKKCNISFHFLGKILQILTKKGLVISYKGPKGGVSLAKAPAEITLLNIVAAIDGLEFLETKCVIGLPNCDHKNPCALHNKWSAIQKNIHNMLAGKNIAQLINNQKQKAIK